MENSYAVDTYMREGAAVFNKTKELYGQLSNMAAGFPLKVNGVRILTSEALYQACRFPHMPEVQKLIIAQPSPMSAKMKGKPHRSNSRQDWGEVMVDIMRWSLKVKLANNFDRFSRMLLATREKPIVEESTRDAFWGAKPKESVLVGANVLGVLLMELREQVKSQPPESLKVVPPLAIAHFELYGEPILEISAS